MLQSWWWPVVPPLVTLLVGSIAAFFAWRSLKQKSMSDRRAQWWVRVQWSLDSAWSDKPEKSTSGIRLIRLLATEQWLTNNEFEILDTAWREPLAAEAEDLGVDAAVPVPSSDVPSAGTTDYSSATVATEEVRESR